ncbi:hypothetical protein ACTHGU_06455 [Chitinophagaceae bacterium MMS25-I14]
MYVLSKPNRAAVICLVGFFFSFFIYFPGFLSPDSIDQYGQALDNTYYDWHPPIMAYVWHWLNYLSKGPQMMLALQLAMLWSSCYLLITGMRNIVGAVVLLLLVAAPFVQNFAGYIVKDTQMAFALLLLFAFLFNRAENSRYTGTGWTIFIFLLLCYASWLRINALPAAVPLVMYGMKKYTGVKRIAGAIAVFVFVMILQGLFTSYVIQPGRDHPENKLFLHDLTAIYRATGENVYPAFLYRQQGFDTAYLRKKYDPATFDEIIANNDGVTVLTDENQDSFRVLKRAWVTAVRKHPLIYLRHRTLGFLYYLRILNSKRPCCAVYLHSDANPFGFVYQPGVISGHILQLITAQENMFYMRPWFWLLLAVLLLMLSWKRKSVYRIPSLVLLSSGILYQVPYFFISPTDTDFRYCYWTVVACVTTVALQATAFTHRHSQTAV